MAEKALSLQDHFLNSLRRAKSPVTVYLLKGVKLSGVISWFDAFSLLLRRDGSTQLIYKHGISTILPTSAPGDFVAPIEPAGGPGGRGSLQDLFLAAAVHERHNLTLYLVNGVMLQGRVAGFDQFSLVLERDGRQQLVYKHAISTVQPDQPIQLRGQESTGGSTGQIRGQSTVELTKLSTDLSTAETISESEA